MAAKLQRCLLQSHRCAVLEDNVDYQRAISHVPSMQMSFCQSSSRLCSSALLLLIIQQMSTKQDAGNADAAPCWAAGRASAVSTVSGASVIVCCTSWAGSKAVRADAATSGVTSSGATGCCGGSRKAMLLLLLLLLLLMITLATPMFLFSLRVALLLLLPLSLILLTSVAAISARDARMYLSVVVV